jgi:predicted Zn-dependent protease
MQALNSAEQPGSYTGAAFLPQLGLKSTPGQITLLFDKVSFLSAEGTVSLPLHALRLHEGGHNSEQLFFDHPEFPGVSIYTSDTRILEDLVLRTNPTLGPRAAEIVKARKRVSLLSLLSVGFVVSLVAAVLLVFVLKDRITLALANRIPIEWEASLADQMFEQFKLQGKAVEKTKWDSELKEIERRLVAAASSDYRFQFHVMQDTNVNAFAMPGGHVIILTGLLEHADTGEEVAGVLAHELAHVTRKHVFRQMIQTAGLFVIVQAIAGDASGLLAVLSNSSRFLLQQKFSRTFEREADDVGWQYLIKAKIDPRGMTRFFEQLVKVESLQNPALAGTLSILETHPATFDRIQRLQKKWDKLPEPKQFTPLPKWETAPSK